MSPIEKLKNVIETIYSNDETFGDLSDVELASCKEAIFTIADAEDLIEQMKQVNLLKLRDEFAGQALIGILSGDGHYYEGLIGAARSAYEVADAMLKVREE